MVDDAEKRFGNNLAVCVVSDYSKLTDNIVEAILVKGLPVVVLSDDVSWENKNFEDKNVTLVKREHWKNIFCGYCVYISQLDSYENSDNKKFEEVSNTFLYLCKINLAKALVVLPRLVDERVFKYNNGFLKKTKEFDELKITFLLTGFFLDRECKNFIQRTVNGVVGKKVLTVPNDSQYIYFSDERNVGKTVIKKLFGFGGGGEIISLGSRVKVDDFVEEFSKLTPSLIVKKTHSKYLIWQNSRDIKERVLWKVRLNELTKELKESNSPNKLRAKESKLPGKHKLLGADSFAVFVASRLKTLLSKNGERGDKAAHKQSKLFTKKYLLVSLLILVFISPFIFLLVSVGELFYSIHLIKQLDVEGARGHLKSAQYFSSLSEKTISNVSSIPGASFVYLSVYDYSRIVEESANLANDSLDIAEDLIETKNKFFGTSKYDVTYYTQDIEQKAKNIYINSGFLLNDIGDKKLINYFLSKKNVDLASLKTQRDKFAKFLPIVSQTPQLLGNNAEKAYLILFQNNMELRPAGGFIGSFAVVKIEGGRLEDLKVYDVYDADGQLKGYVKPPEPISQYLNSSGWYLRDSNWNPDFEESAKTAEWFLDKEMDMSFDGVVAVDLNFLDKLMSNFDSIYLKDYGISLNQNNFYQEIQNEVEDNFFPGSINKKSLLSSLVNELTNELMSDSGSLNINFVKNVLSSLDQRNIQLYLHDQISQDVVGDMGWNGSMKNQTCTENCVNDFAAVVEANVGVDKVNYYIRRSIDFNIEISEERLQRNMTVTIQNAAEEKLNGFPWYKNYIRAFANKDAQFLPVSVSVDGDESILEPTVLEENNLKSAGIYLQIKPQQKAIIKFSWVSANNANLKKNGEYLIHIRKQAGTDSDPLSVLVDVNSSSLTGGGNFLYNTNLSRDFVSRVYW